MKKITKITLVLLALISFNTTSLLANNEYIVDDAAVENALNIAQDNLFTMNFDFNNSLVPAQSCAKMGSSNAWIAFGLAVVVWVLPPILRNLGIIPLIPGGLHRIYLGTKTFTWIGYLLTCGGCGIVQFVDAILLFIGVIKNDISKYEDNPKFFMW